MNSYIKFSNSSAEMKFVCDAAKNTECEQNTCLCDVELADQLIANIGHFDSSNANSSGFDATVECFAGNNNHAKPNTCCGAYPTRFPFHSKGGERGCCGGLYTYSTSAMDCCSDGTLELLGQCSSEQCGCLNGGTCTGPNGSCVCKGSFSLVISFFLTFIQPVMQDQCVNGAHAILIHVEFTVNASI